MVFRNQISITADSGVGSTTTARKLHDLLGVSPWRWVNAGAIMRTFAKEKGMSIEEFARHNLDHPEERYDEQCDTLISHFGEHDYVIFEGRLVHHFAPHAFHVRLICDPHIRAERRVRDFPGMTEREILEKIEERDRVNMTRYTQIYGSHVIWPDEKFDLVLDTGLYPPDLIAAKIIEGHKTWLAREE